MNDLKEALEKIIAVPAGYHAAAQMEGIARAALKSQTNTVAQGAQVRAATIKECIAAVRGHYGFSDDEKNIAVAVLHALEPSFTAQPPAAPVETAGIEEDDPEVLIAAKAIAEHGFGRPWDDFHACDASKTDQGDLLEYGRAAVAALRVHRCSADTEGQQ